MDKKILIFILGIFFLSLISGAATLDNQYTLRVSCESFTCADVNLTLTFPNSTLWIDNKEMTDNNYYASYNFKPPIRGDYDYYISDGENITKDYIPVTATGHELNSAQMFLYFLILILLIGLFGLCMWGAIKIEFKNVRNSEDQVIKVNWKKYMKIACGMFAYLLLLAIIFVAWNLTWAYSDWDNFSIFLQYLFTVLGIIALPTLIYSWIMIIVNFGNDKKITKFIKKTGLPYDG